MGKIEFLFLKGVLASCICLLAVSRSCIYSH